MPYGFRTDPDLDRSTNTLMAWGVGLIAAMVLAFPVYRWFEPSARKEAREVNLQSLAGQGEHTFSLNCSSCHGLNGEGGVGPALNSQQFLTSATDEQIRLLVSVGIPGTQMSAYAQDHGGPLTSEQIKAITVFMRSWEEDAPDRPDWRTPGQGG